MYCFTLLERALRNKDFKLLFIKIGQGITKLRQFKDSKLAPIFSKMAAAQKRAKRTFSMFVLQEKKALCHYHDYKNPFTHLLGSVCSKDR